MCNLDKQLLLSSRHRPPETLLSNWKLWLAYEVVTQLKESQAVEVKLSSICSELDSIDSKVFPTIYQDFCESINSLKTKTYSSKKANFSRLELEEFYSQVVFQHLHKVGQDLQLNAVQYLQKSLSEDMSRASPKNLIKFLRDLIKFLVARRSNFEEQRISKLAFEESASRALINLYDLSLD